MNNLQNIKLTPIKLKPINITLDQINKEMDKQKLLGMAYFNEGMMYSKQIESDAYAENCVALAKKLGFAITEKNLNNAVKVLDK